MRILCSHIFSTKNNSVFVTLADICLTNLCLNDIVKLTMLLTTGSCCLLTLFQISITMLYVYYIKRDNLKTLLLKIDSFTDV